MDGGLRERERETACARQQYAPDPMNMTDEQCRKAQRIGLTKLYDERNSNPCRSAENRVAAERHLRRVSFCDERQGLNALARTAGIRQSLPPEVFSAGIAPLHPSGSGSPATQPRLVLHAGGALLPLVPVGATDLEVVVTGVGPLAAARTLAARIHGQLGDALRQITLTVSDRARMRDFLNGIPNQADRFPHVKLLQLTEPIDHDNLPVLLQRFPHVRVLYLTTIRMNHLPVRHRPEDHHCHLRTLQVSVGAPDEDDDTIALQLDLLRHLVDHSPNLAVLKLRVPEVRWIPRDLKVRELVLTGAWCAPHTSHHTTLRRQASTGRCGFRCRSDGVIETLMRCGSTTPRNRWRMLSSTADRVCLCVSVCVCV